MVEIAHALSMSKEIVGLQKKEIFLRRYVNTCFVFLMYAMDVLKSITVVHLLNFAAILQKRNILLIID